MALQRLANPRTHEQPGLPRDLQLALQLCGNATDAPRGLAMLASTLQFDGLSYLALNDGTTTDGVAFHLTTAGPDWSARYAKLNYHSIDPRILGTQGRHVPIIWGAAHIAVGLPLRRHQHWSRLAALMLGSVDLLLLPYGTALGCYTLWALLHQDGRKLFTESAR